MSALTWAAFPIVATIIAGVILTRLNRSSDDDHRYREVERFDRFRRAMEQQVNQPAPRSSSSQRGPE